MPDDPNKDKEQKELKDLLGSIFNSTNWRERVEREMRDKFRLTRKLALARKETDELKEQLETAKPKDGSVVMTKADSEELVAYRALVPKSADLKVILTEHGTLKAKDEERAMEAQFAEAGEALGWENIPALTRFLKRENLVLEFKETSEKDEDGKRILTRLPYVRPKADEKAAPVALDEYVEKEVPEFIDIFATAPALGEDDDDEGTEEGGEGNELVGAGAGGGIRRTDIGARGRQVTRSEARARGGDRSTGVRIAGTRGVRADAVPGTRDKKTLEKAEEDARRSGVYNV